MPGFRDFGIVFEQRSTDPANPPSDKAIIYVLNDNTMNAMFPDGSKVRLDTAAVEATLNSITGNFATHSEVSNVSGALLVDIAALTSTLGSLTGSLQGQITDLGVVNGLQSVAIASLSGAVTDLGIVNSLQSSAIQSLSAAVSSIIVPAVTGYATVGLVASVSGNLQSEIDNLSSTVTNVSAGLQSQILTLQSEIDGTNADVATNYSTLVSVSGTLQSEIDALGSVVSGVSGSVLSSVSSISGTLQTSIDGVYASLVSVSGSLDSRLTDVEIVNGLQSSDIQALSAAVASIMVPSVTGYATVGLVASVSGNLQSEIDSVYSDLVSVSGSIEGEISSINSSITFLMDNLDDVITVNGLQSTAIQDLSAAQENFALQSDLVSVSGTLSGEISSLNSYANAIEAEVIDLRAISDLHSTAIADLSASLADTNLSLNSDVAALSAHVTDIEVVNALQSGDIQALSAALASFGGDLSNYALKTEVWDASAALDSKKFDKTGGQIAGDVIISGNLSVSGGYFVTYTEHVSAKDNLITINAGEQGAGVTAGVAGIEVDRGTLPKYDFFFVEASQSFRVGEEGNTQAVATREDTPNDQVIPFWNAAQSRFDTTETYLTPSFVRSLTGQVDGSLRTEVAGITSQLVAITASHQLQINTLAASSTNHEFRIQHLEAEVATISASLGAVYKGLEPGVIGQNVYTISHAAVNTVTDFPLVSLITPAASSTLYVQSITNRTSTSFDTVLSGLPDENGYAISWQISTTSASIVVPSGSGSGNYVSKTGNESVAGIKIFTNSMNISGDLDIAGKLTVAGLIDPTGLQLVPQASNPGTDPTNTLWLNASDSNKLYVGSDAVGTGGSTPNLSGVGYWAVATIAVTSQDALNPTIVTIDASINTSQDISLQGFGHINTPNNMQNGQSVNILMTQDAEPYDWDIDYSTDIEFPYGVPVVPTSGAEATTVVTLLKMRNRYFATGLFEFL